MPLLPLLVLALIQGACEILPLSAAGHFAVLFRVFHWSPPTASALAAGQIGIALALALYFHREVWRAIKGCTRLIRGRRTDADTQLFLNLLIATIPAALASIFLQDLAAVALRSLAAIAAVNLLLGFLLLVIDRLGMTVRRIGHMGTSDALLLGLAQLIVFLPGAGRGAPVLVAARLLGYERQEAVRFAMLMGLPLILGAGLWQFLELYRTTALRLDPSAAVSGALAALAALVILPLLLSWVRRRSLAPFALYRLAFGAALLVWLIRGPGLLS